MFLFAMFLSSESSEGSKNERLISCKLQVVKQASVGHKVATNHLVTFTDLLFALITNEMNGETSPCLLLGGVIFTSNMCRLSGQSHTSIKLNSYYEYSQSSFYVYLFIRL